MPPIDRYMTRQPWTLGPSATLLDAHKLMKARGVRHVPIVEDGRIVGVLSEVDLLRLEPFVELGTTQVREAMTEPPYTARPDDAVDGIVREMGDHKRGCVVIVRPDGGVEGIFTSSDACRVLADILDRAVA